MKHTIDLEKGDYEPLFTFHPKGAYDFLPRLGDVVALMFCLAKSRANSWALEMSGLGFFVVFWPLKIHRHPFIAT